MQVRRKVRTDGAHEHKTKHMLKAGLQMEHTAVGVAHPLAVWALTCPDAGTAVRAGRLAWQCRVQQQPVRDAGMKAEFVLLKRDRWACCAIQYTPVKLRDAADRSGVRQMRRGADALALRHRCVWR